MMSSPKGLAESWLGWQMRNEEVARRFTAYVDRTSRESRRTPTEVVRELAESRGVNPYGYEVACLATTMEIMLNPRALIGRR